MCSQLGPREARAEGGMGAMCLGPHLVAHHPRLRLDAVGGRQLQPRVAADLRRRGNQLGHRRLSERHARRRLHKYLQLQLIGGVEVGVDEALAQAVLAAHPALGVLEAERLLGVVEEAEALGRPELRQAVGTCSGTKTARYM